MRIVYNPDELTDYMDKAIDLSPDHPVLLDKYLTNAIEVDVDSLSDGSDCVIAGLCSISKKLEFTLVTRRVLPPIVNR